MASAEGGIIEAPKFPSGVRYEEECPFPSRLRVFMGERRKLPQRVSRRSPGQKHILAYFKGLRRSFLHLCMP